MVSYTRQQHNLRMVSLYTYTFYKTLCLMIMIGVELVVKANNSSLSIWSSRQQRRISCERGGGFLARNVANGAVHVEFLACDSIHNHECQQNCQSQKLISIVIIDDWPPMAQLCTLTRFVYIVAMGSQSIIWTLCTSTWLPLAESAFCGVPTKAVTTDESNDEHQQ